MAKTYQYDEVIRMVSRFVPRNVVDDHSAEICNVATNEIWKKYDWRDSLKTLPPFYLIPDEQDHGPPAVAVPTDFWGLRKANLVSLNSVPPARRLLKVIKDLELTHIRFFPHAISYNADTRSFRVFPRVPTNVGAPSYFIDGTYKYRPTKITASTIATAIPMDDIYLEMWYEGMRWAAMNFAGDPKAGDVQMNGPNKIYTGQLAKFHIKMDEIAGAEGLELGDVNIHPNEPLVTTNMGQTLSIFGGWNF